MRRFVIGILLIHLVFFAEAQKAQRLSDTIRLDEIVTYGDLRKYQSGAKINSIPSEQIKLVQEGGLDNVLKRFTPIYIKSNAGGLSTIRFRGTSPDHTSVNFGGINLNSLTLGHSNLSNIPSFLFDNIQLQYGSSSAVNGSGAIGGALYLGLGNNWTNGWQLSVKTTVGSFGEYLAGAKAFVGNGRWESVSRIYFYKKENNFPFNNPYTGDVENPGAVRDIQNGASIQNMGLLQEVNYRFNPNHFIKSAFWIENSWHQVQPNMQSNYKYKGTQEIENDNLRFWTEYVNNLNTIRYKAGLGYVHDMQVYDKIEEQIIGTDRLIGEAQATTDFSNGLGLKAGAKYKYIKPDVHAYADSVIDFEQHFDIFFSSFYRINQQLKVTLNLRQTFVSNFEAPFTPSLGAEYILRTNDNSFLKFTGALAKSFRVPTFNDRYWGTQGNPNLLPEAGKNAELGTQYNVENENWSSSLGVNVFYMNVDNWIEWRNFGVWRAENVLEVVSKGIEVQSNTRIPMGGVVGRFTLNYTFNPVEPVATIEETGLLHRQMNYVPKHMSNASATWDYHKWRLFVDAQYTGERYTDDFGNQLPAHLISNCGLAYKMELAKGLFDIVLTANNLFNVDYQNEKYYAMPGRHFRLSLKYELKRIQ